MLRTALTLFIAIVGATALIAQPSLDPPAGPIEESGRFGTLIELSQDTAPGDADSVFRINEPGSYVLTGDVVVPFDTTGIEIASDDVTLDLNGYTIRGVEGSFGVGVGVPDASEGAAEYSNLVVRNGVIRDVLTAVEVVDLDVPLGTAVFSVAPGATLDGLRISDCNDGIDATRASISDCVIEVQRRGIINPKGGVDGCSVLISQGACDFGAGFEVTSGRVTDTTVELGSAVEMGFPAFVVRESVVRGCTALLAGNGTFGFVYVNDGASVSDCVVKNRSASAADTVAFLGEGVTANCTAIGTSIGFQCLAGVVRGCAALECTVASALLPGVVSDGNNF